MIRITLIAFIALVGAGCSTVKKVDLINTWKPEQAEFILNEGQATIEVESFLRKNDGSLISAAGVTVTLLPDTLHSRERLGYIYGNPDHGFRVKSNTSLMGWPKSVHNFEFNPDAGFEYSKTYVRNAIMDSTNQAVFQNVPKGKYFVICNLPYAYMYWNPISNSMSTSYTLHAMCRSVAADENGSVKVILSNTN